MATVTKRGKTWTAIYLDAAGKQRWVKGYKDKVETKRLADRLEDEARRIKLGDVDPQAEVLRLERAKPIDSHVADYKAKLQAAGRSAGHVAYTIADVEKLVTFGAVKSASEITLPLVDRWVLSLKKAGEDANKTLNRRVSSVQQFLRHLHEVGGVNNYTLKRYPKLPTGSIHRKRHTRPLDQEELNKLQGETTPEARRDLYRFASLTGLRLSECRQITADNLDLKHRNLTVPAHVAKAKRDQIIPLHAALLPIVKGAMQDKPADGPLFHVPTKKVVTENLRRDCRHAKVSEEHVGFHSFRHTFCTLLARANVHPALLQKLARHADLKTTLSYYVHLRRSDEAEAINQL